MLCIEKCNLTLKWAHPSVHLTYMIYWFHSGMSPFQGTCSTAKYQQSAETFCPVWILVKWLFVPEFWSSYRQTVSEAYEPTVLRHRCAKIGNSLNNMNTLYRRKRPYGLINEKNDNMGAKTVPRGAKSHVSAYLHLKTTLYFNLFY